MLSLTISYSKGYYKYYYYLALIEILLWLLFSYLISIN